jgi:chemotaxis protein CheD
MKQNLTMPAMERTELAQNFVVGMADLVVLRRQDAFLCSQPLGAGLGVGIHDPATGVGGLLHSLLPEAAGDPPRAAARPAMFLDAGLAELIKRAGELGARRENLLVYAAGGGRILDDTKYFDIGRRNCDMLLRWLAENGLQLAAGDLGGLVNRVLQLNPVTGEVRVKESGEAKPKILCKRLMTT